MRKAVIVVAGNDGLDGANERYMRDAIEDSLRIGEAPLSMAALYRTTGVLGDQNGIPPGDREIIRAAQNEWSGAAKATVVYYDLGTGYLAREAIEDASREGREVIFRSLPAWHAEQFSLPLPPTP